MFSGYGSSRLNQSPPLIRLGLVGQLRGYGLAHQNREIADHLSVERWLCEDSQVPEHYGQAVMTSLPEDATDDRLREWLNGLEAVMFVERPTFNRLPAIAQSMGIAVICVPMWEWLFPKLEWLAYVDRMICPTQFAATLLKQWQSEYKFSWQVNYLPWPIDVERFIFRQRDVCRRFVYVHGSGGSQAVGLKSGRLLRRKGLETIVTTARLVPQIPIVVHAFTEQLPGNLPDNLLIKVPPRDNRLLYAAGDVCVQPSLWEGLGRPLLECQASGVPLITGDAPPMNEHRPLCMVRVEIEQAQLTPQITIPVAHMQAEDLAASLRSVFGRNISRQSSRARRFVERHHNWQSSGRRIASLIQQSIAHAT